MTKENTSNNTFDERDTIHEKSSDEKPLSEKTTEDFAKYFQTTYKQPNINKARKRFREDIEVHYDFEIPQNVQNIGEGKKFLNQTYGCQMNEHDSETMAGILQEMGYMPTTVKEIGRASCREREERARAATRG